MTGLNAAEAEPLQGGASDLDAYVHVLLLEVHVEAGDARSRDAFGEALACPPHVECIAMQESALSGAFAMSLQHADGLNGVLHLALRGGGLHSQHCIDCHLQSPTLDRSDHGIELDVYVINSNASE
jgi:hypothetical protein